MPLPLIPIINANGQTVNVNSPNSGRQAATDSQAVALSTEDLAAIGSTSSSAAADETATTGLNGLIKGVFATIRARIPTLSDNRMPVEVQNIATSTRFYNFAQGQRLTTSGAGAVRSTAITGTEVLLHASVRGFFAVGTSTVTASVGAGSIPLAQDEKFHLRIATGSFISFVRDGSTDGSITIMPVV